MNIKKIIFSFSALSFISACSVSNLSNTSVGDFVNQNLDELLSLTRSSECQTLNTSRLRELVDLYGSQATDVFGISVTEIENKISEYEDEDQSSVCVLKKNLPEGNNQTRSFYFFSIDDNLSTEEWTEQTITITETYTDNTTQTYDFGEIEVIQFEDYLEDAASTDFAFSSVLDYSGSMAQSDLTNLETAMSLLYDNIPENFSSEIIKFSTEVEVITSYTNNQTLLENGISDSNIRRSSTALNDAMFEGLNNTQAQEENVKFIATFTDGLENASTRTQAAVINYAQENEIPIITIGLGDLVDVANLAEYSAETGGFFLYVPTSTDFDEVYEELSEYISNLHLVRWTSANAKALSSVQINLGNEITREIDVQ